MAAASEAKRRGRVSSPSPLKRQAPAPSGGKIAPKPDKVAACLATRVHNFPGRESFLPERHSAQEGHDANRHGRCGVAAVSYVQVCRSRYSPSTKRHKRTALKPLRQGFGRQPWPDAIVNEATLHDRMALASIIGATQANYFEPRPGFRLTINFAVTVGKTNALRRRARLKPLKLLHRERRAIPSARWQLTCACYPWTWAAGARRPGISCALFLF
ncbi:hypothetical protein ACVWVY_004184 [Bradyrhizobium sp. URHC0002]